MQTQTNKAHILKILFGKRVGRRRGRGCGVTRDEGVTEKEKDKPYKVVCFFFFSPDFRSSISPAELELLALHTLGDRSCSPGTATGQSRSVIARGQTSKTAAGFHYGLAVLQAMWTQTCLLSLPRSQQSSRTLRKQATGLHSRRCPSQTAISKIRESERTNIKRSPCFDA